MENISYGTLMNTQVQREVEERETLLGIQKQLGNILNFMKAECSMRNIERKLDFFYYPLKDYLDTSWTTNQSERDIEKIAQYSSFATETTEKQFNIFRNTKGSQNEESQNSHDLLLKYVNEDITHWENSLKSVIKEMHMV